MRNFLTAIVAALLLLTTTANAEDSETYFRQGNYYYELGMYEQAIQDFNKAIELKPNYSHAYNNRGVAYRKLGLNDLAIADFEKALEIDPNFTTARNNLGRSSSDIEELLRDVNSLITIQPKE